MASSSEEDQSDSLFAVADTDDPGKLIRVNFYISNDLPAFLRDWLTAVIEAHDGRVSNKKSDSFPARGYILVDPTTPDAEELRRRHDRVSKRPSLRHLVDWKFVPACLEARRIINWDEIPDGDNVFQKDDEDEGWPVFLYPKGDKATLLKHAYHLSRHGAELVENQAAANFIVCDPRAKAHARLLAEYVSDRSTFVVAPPWIAQCINSGRVKPIASQPNVPHFRPRGVPYTAEQDQHLVEYLAAVCPIDVPYLSSRLSMRLYNDLVANVTRYPWAKAHPAQSWRERYKKRRDELTPRIERLVARRNRASGKRKASSGNDVDQRSDSPAPKRVKTNVTNNIASTSGNRGSSNRSPPDGHTRIPAGRTAESHLPTPKNKIDKQLHTAATNSPRASRGHSMPVPRRDHDAAAVYFESDDDGAPLPSGVVDVVDDPVIIEPQKPAKSRDRMTSPQYQEPGGGKQAATPPEEENITPEILVDSEEPALRAHAETPITAHVEHGRDTDHAVEQSLSHVMPSNADVPLSPADEEVPPSCEMTRADNHDGTNSHTPQPTKPNDEAALPSQAPEETAAETSSEEEPVPTFTRVLRSRSISVQPPSKSSSKGKRRGRTEKPATLPQIPEQSPAPGSDDAVMPGNRNSRPAKNRDVSGDRGDKQPAVSPNGPTGSPALRPLAPPAAPYVEFEDGVVEAVDPIQGMSGPSANTDDEKEVEIALSQARPKDMNDEGSPMVEDRFVAAVGSENDQYETEDGSDHEYVTDQPSEPEPEKGDPPPRPRRAPAPLPSPLPPLRAKSPSPTSTQYDATPPLPSRYATVISVDYSPAAKDHRGAETQAVMEERERAKSLDSDYDNRSPMSIQRHPASPFPSQYARAVSVDYSPAARDHRGAESPTIMEERGRAKSPNSNYDNRSPTSIQRDTASPFPSQYARAISVDYSPAAKDQRGAETLAIMEERERTVQAGRRALALDFGAHAPPGGHPSPIFKGKARAHVSGDNGVAGSRLQEARHMEPPPRRPLLPARTLPAVDASDGRRAVPPVYLEEDGAFYQRSAHLPTSPPRHSYLTSSTNNPIAEDSDEHFAGLDRIMTRALRALCRRYRFSAMDVRLKFELRDQNLASTKKVLEANRRTLDQDSLFQDLTQ